jgi:hypothetical protein
MRRLDSLAVGEEFVWSGVPFRLESKEPETGHDGRQYLPVTYLATDSKGGEHFKAGDRGLMPVEATIVEADGYRYTNPHDPAECRGCDFERLTGKPCPLHTKEHGKEF